MVKPPVNSSVGMIQWEGISKGLHILANTDKKVHPQTGVITLTVSRARGIVSPQPTTGGDLTMAK